ncbi:MAG: ribosome hibernation-promoting factor, HPF/YfiA family [Candidatus Saccharimonadales bacterium]|jgi:ribosomal subunit interface protein
MIQKLEIAGVHTSVDEKLHRYVIKKIGKLDTYIARHARKSAHAEVLLKKNHARNSSKLLYACEVIIYLPHEVVRVEEATLNLYAAVDIVEEKLKHQLKKYKELHTSPKLHRRVIARLKRQTA